MERIIQPENYDYACSQRIKKELKLKFPFLTVHTIGKSALKREIIAYSLGNYKNIVLFAGGFHAQEWLTALVLLRFLENMCESVKLRKKLSGVDVTSSLMSKGITVIPCVNPDGTEIVLNGPVAAGEYAELVKEISKGDLSSWNANARGVDINHNFDAGWQILREMETEQGITGPSPRRFGGYAPHSEPETQALVKYCERNNIDHAFAIHSQGEEIYWSYGSETPENSLTMANIFSVCSGYRLVQNDGLASHGGFKDWFIECFRRSAFTIETGKGKNPLPVTQLDEIYEKIEEMLVVGAII